MTKFEIINKLLIDYNVWEVGYSRATLENYDKDELEDWLEGLDESNP